MSIIFICFYNIKKRCCFLDLYFHFEFIRTKLHCPFKVARVVVHKDYKAPTFENDIAILELKVLECFSNSIFVS